VGGGWELREIQGIELFGGLHFEGEHEPPTFRALPFFREPFVQFPDDCEHSVKRFEEVIHG